MFCVRICNKNDLLCYSCSKKVSNLRMGRIYCQDSGGDPLNRETYNDIIVPMMQHIQELEERIKELEAKTNDI